MKSSKRRILILSDWFLPGYKAGGPIRSLANFVSYLRTDFEIFLVCGDRDYLENKPYEGIPQNKWIEKYGIKILYLPPKNRQINTFTTIIEQLNPDSIYINGIFSRRFSINPLIALQRSKRQIVVAPRGMLAKGAIGIKGLKKRLFLTAAKLIKLYGNVQFHATSDQESSDIKRFFAKNKIVRIPNLPSPALAGLKSRKKDHNQIKILTIARIASEKNILFAIECLENINPELSVQFDLIGAVYSEDYKNKCVKRAQSLPTNIEVRFLGSKSPSEIESYYRSHHLFFLPTLGENYGHAIVEALMASQPVLISNSTPWRELQKDQLGADFDLRDKDAFCKFIEKVGTMNQSQYRSYTAGISSKFANRLDLKGNISSYQELFNGEG